jgi:hypothetical protein
MLKTSYLGWRNDTNTKWGMFEMHIWESKREPQIAVYVLFTLVCQIQLTLLLRLEEIGYLRM